MNKEELTALFRAKVNLEQKRYHRKMLKLKPENIYDRAYEIGCMVNISEVLLEKSEAMEEGILKCLLVLPNLLHFFYSRWMKTGDSFQTELEDSMDNSIREIQKMAGVPGKEEAA